MRRGFTLIEVMITLAILGIVAAVIYGAVQDARHPCVRWEEYPCTTTRCIMFMPNGSNGSICSAYRTEESTCSRCLERKAEVPTSAPAPRVIR